LGRVGVLSGQNRDPMPPAKMIAQSGASVSGSIVRDGATEGDTVDAVPAPPDIPRDPWFVIERKDTLRFPRAPPCVRTSPER
jgi:hypothetical protein